jgi:hypothetical protein
LLLVPLVTALVLVATSETLRLINGPSVELTFSGAMTGRMTKLSAWQGHDSTCSVGKVDTTRQWDGQFVGTLNGKHFVLNIALTPYHGPGRYSDDGIPDAQTVARMTPAQFFQLKIEVHILLSSMPAGAPTVTQYGTEPNPAARPTSMEQLGKLGGLGQASVTLNPDQKSGRIQTNLMNARVPTNPAVRLDGSFKCQALSS